VISTCAQEGREAYERESARRANAEIIPLDVDACDAEGNPLVLHFVQRASKPIKAGDEVRACVCVCVRALCAGDLNSLTFDLTENATAFLA
jgi:hypothetical protein